ncbi:MAG: nucleotidyltransferase domain-containing protein [Phycisphaerae bacterium]|nr:nucleotidyltransferase domain-containing protein [Phycisphaerae bacterium]
METDKLLKRVKSLLQDAFGERLRGVILYGSEARGEAEPDSDIDFLVLLEGPVNHWNDSRTCIHSLYDLVLKLDRPIHAKPVDIRDYEAQEYPLYQNAKHEGVFA